MGDCQPNSVPVQVKPHSTVLAITMAVTFFLLFIGFTVGFVTWQIDSSQAKFCTLMTTLAHAPAPTGKQDVSTPARNYDQIISKDIIQLKGSLGC